MCYRCHSVIIYYKRYRLFQKSKIQYNLNGHISTPDTAVQVYDRLGLVAGTRRGNRFLHTRNCSSRAPVEELHKCTLSRLMTALIPALRTVCAAFGGTANWRELLYYAANNVELHAGSIRHVTSATNKKMWRDKVYLTVLAKSSFVKNLVQRFNRLRTVNDRASRRSRRRILSEICLDLPLRVVNRLGFKLPVLPAALGLQPKTKVRLFLVSQTVLW